MKLSMLVTLVALSAAGFAQADPIADFAADYSRTTQGNNGWYYQYVADGNYNNFVNMSYNSSVVAWAFNGTNDVYISSPDYLQTGGNKWSQVRWVSTVAGEININGYFQCVLGNASESYTGQTYIIRVNGEEVWSQFGKNIKADNIQYAYDMNLTVNVGDKIDFLCNPTGNAWWDAYAMRSTITAVPEPAGLVLLGFGSLIALRRRK